MAIIKSNFHYDSFPHDVFKDALFNDEVLKINGISIPNFYKNYRNTIWEKKMIVYELNHLIYKIFLSNGNLTFYETENFKINKNDIVFDCGGNMGFFSAAVADRCKSIYAFEPMSLVRKNLRITASLYKNIFIIPCGLYNKNCDMFLL